MLEVKPTRSSRLEKLVGHGTQGFFNNKVHKKREEELEPIGYKSLKTSSFNCNMSCTGFVYRILIQTHKLKITRQLGTFLKVLTGSNAI